MKIKRGLTSLAVLACAVVGSARAEDRVVLEASRSTIDVDCNSLHQLGIDCKFVSTQDMTGPEGTKDRWVPISSIELPPRMQIPSEKLTWFERMSGLPFYGQILLFKQTDNAGNAYWVGHPAVVTQAGAQTPNQVSSHQEDLWDIASQVLPTAAIDSDGATEFFSRIDADAAAAAAKAAQVAAEKAAAACAAAAAAAADRAYRASPAYHRQQLKEAASNCRQTIARAQAAIDRDQRIAAVSGYENKLVREQAAEMIVDCQDVIARARNIP